MQAGALRDILVDQKTVASYLSVECHNVSSCCCLMFAFTVLCCAVLCYAVLCCAVRCGAVRCGVAALHCAV